MGAENFENDRTTKKQGLGQKAQQNAKKASKQKPPHGTKSGLVYIRKCSFRNVAKYNHNLLEVRKS